MTNTSRRSFMTALASLVVTAPSIVRAASLMPVKAMEPFDPSLYGRWVSEDIRFGDSFTFSQGLPSIRNRQTAIRIIEAAERYSVVDYVNRDPVIARRIAAPWNL